MRLAVILVFFITAQSRADEYREWTSGKFSCVAALVSEGAGEVTLKKLDGTTVVVPIKRLDVEHQLYIAKRRSTEPVTKVYDVRDLALLQNYFQRLYAERSRRINPMNQLPWNMQPKTFVTPVDRAYIWPLGFPRLP